MPSRRDFVVMSAAAAGAAVLVGGGLYARYDRYGGWIHEVLERWLPGYRLVGVEHFIDDYNVKQRDADKLLIFAAVEGVTNARALLPGSLAIRTEEEERRLFSDFLVGSDFFRDGKRVQGTITYLGRQAACGSPFATF